MTGFRLQELIHQLDQGTGAKVIRGVFFIVALIGLAVLYDSLCFRNLATAEAMDTAQLANNIARKKSFTTQVIRPFSIYLLARHRTDHSALLAQDHPDLANAPLYPLLLAPVMQVPDEDMVAAKNFSVARKDLAIAIFNQVLMLISVLAVFRLARRWFDGGVALMAAVLFAATELYWRFTVSGLSTNLLILLVLLLAGALSTLGEATTPEWPARRVALIAGWVGLLLGLMALTRYACGFLLLPVAMYVAVVTPGRRGVAFFALLLVFLALLGPWIARNMIVSGTPFGTASFAVMEQTRPFPEDRLQRSLHPNFSLVQGAEYVRKLVQNGRDVVSSDLPRMGGSWIWAFFLAGLLVRFRSVALSRIRWFVVLALLTLLPVQALGKTQIWTESPEINSENLLVLFSPFVLIFGVAAFLVLLDSLEIPMERIRYALGWVFGGVMSLPLLLALAPPHPLTVVYPPYYPPAIQLLGRWLEPANLMMTDVPAAIGWYANRQAVMTTMNWRNEFAEIHDFHKPINGLYLTSRTLARPFLGEWMRGETNTWESFVIELQTRREVPTGFPLKRAAMSYLSEGQLLMMDYDRWRKQP